VVRNGKLLSADGSGVGSGQRSVCLWQDRKSEHRSRANPEMEMPMEPSTLRCLAAQPHCRAVTAGHGYEEPRWGTIGKNAPDLGHQCPGDPAQTEHGKGRAFSFAPVISRDRMSDTAEVPR